MLVREHRLTVPVDWAAPAALGSLDLFAREVVDPAKDAERLPLLVFLQGGPGGKSPRPTGADGWLAVALERFRVILVDQRGTGRSGRIEGRAVTELSDDEAACLLLCFRADSIVRDLEALRTEVYGGRRWSTLGQSYGGFITLRYLSVAPEALAACYITGGLASLEPSAAGVYTRTYPRAASKTAKYYDRYPGDVGRVAAIADRVAAGDVLLPDGDVLTVRRLQLLGMALGSTTGAERLHWLLDEALSTDGELSDTFLAQVMTLTSYDDGPLFAVLQESIYGSGPGATGWAAADELTRHPAFAEDARPLQLLGEMMFPWMFDEIRSLRPFRAAANALAAVPEYAELYDRAVLATNEVPVSAVVYQDDLYVDAGLSLDTAAAVGNLETWVSADHEHDGLHVDDTVFRRLLEMTDDRGGARGDR